ncbi:MprA protease, GlyGly-CTERM protein-sorting domain-containing form [Vibrio vulnificus]|nr:MprA protease, GlyGly-CTERM protein-sorting domain-containing form [Vibrio vulnificus]EGR7952949.1 MprA protease, GlyGly-CTERM protein-sorting domain-containing form [Vibrio vulnificus]EHT4940549.1 MprA protease, GlyGly-CTERM protein-sorting domain-containing form [Vibrio vulnificus]EIF5019214.1 MprA protease, GlyGly-CTERM protein-sorting domain-containing form [Vibrio vulnificus]EIO2323507.1 MprA protease, GlyGly-CTERM protein-sorting domain-containing form [Vibrio vulnificus]
MGSPSRRQPLLLASGLAPYCRRRYRYVSQTRIRRACW